MNSYMDRQLDGWMDGYSEGGCVERMHEKLSSPLASWTLSQ